MKLLYSLILFAFVFALKKNKPTSITCDHDRRLNQIIKSEDAARLGEERKYWTRQIRLQWVTVLVSFLAVGVTGYYARLQWIEMKKTTDAAIAAATTAQNSLQDARENFRRDQRPYIWLTKTGTEAPVFVPRRDDPATGQIIWTWHHTNYGKSPAQNVRYVIYYKLGDGPRKPAFGSKRPAFAAPLPPEKDDFGTIVSEPLEQSEYNRLLGLSGSIQMSVQIEYTDSYGMSYETGICMSRLNSGAMSYCLHGNYIK